MELLLILKKYWDKFKSQIIMGLVILFMGLLLIKVWDNGRYERKIYENNVKALTEEVSIWKTKAGDAVAEKTVLEGDYKLLKETNSDLYEQIKQLKVKPKEVVYVETEIVNEVHDTSFVFIPDTGYVKKDFDFSDEWRTLTGYLEYKQPNLNLSITKDVVSADFTVAIKDSKVYVTSKNPHIQYNDIQGVVVPPTKYRYSIGVGPSINAGYDLLHKDFGINVGISANLQYNIASFGKKK